MKERETEMNKDIRAYAKQHNVKLWEIAARLGMYDTTLSKKLRFELPEEMKNKIRVTVDEIASEKGSSAAVSN